MRKLSESIWSDIQDRSMGEKIRKEDDIELLDRDGFYDYLVKRYEYLYPKRYNILNLELSDQIIIPMLKSQDGISLNLIMYNIDKPKDMLITITDDSQLRSSDLFIKLEDKYKLISCGRILPKIKIEPKSERDNINKSFFISIIDTILELNTEYEPLIKKK